MCGRYTLHQRVKDIAERFGLGDVPGDVTESYNIAPGQVVPVIVQDGSERRLEMMKWGLMPAWSKDPNIGYKLINARADTIFDKPMWRRDILHHRALIPADGFYEWRKPVRSKERKHPFYVHPKEDTVFAFAGVWEAREDPEGADQKTFSIITTEANKDITPIHNRMPVILHETDEAAWLEPANETREAIEPFLHPYDDDALDIYEVSTNVNIARNNDAKLIYPVNSR